MSLCDLHTEKKENGGRLPMSISCVPLPQGRAKGTDDGGCPRGHTSDQCAPAVHQEWASEDRPEYC
jgi:hypothetical protein